MWCVVLAMDGALELTSLELTSLVCALSLLVLTMSCEMGDLERHGAMGSLPIHTDSKLYGMTRTDWYWVGTKDCSSCIAQTSASTLKPCSNATFCRSVKFKRDCLQT